MSSYFCRLDHFRFHRPSRACRKKLNLMCKEERRGGAERVLSAAMQPHERVRAGFVNLWGISEPWPIFCNFAERFSRPVAVSAGTRYSVLRFFRLLISPPLSASPTATGGAGEGTALIYGETRDGNSTLPCEARTARGRSSPLHFPLE